MVYTCCVPGCKTGYKSNKTIEKISLFKFPGDESLKQLWIKAIPRKNWTLTYTHRVCAKHFHEEDFFADSIDKNASRRDARDTERLKRSRLKPNVVPHIFPNLPSYLSKDSFGQGSGKASRLTTNATAAARLEKENKALAFHNDMVFEEEKFDDFASFKKKIQLETLPDGYLAVMEDNQAWFHYISTPETTQNPIKTAPNLLASVLVTGSFQVKAFVRSATLPCSAYKHLLTSQYLTTTSELTNLLALCKSLSDNSHSNNTHQYLLNLTVSLLEEYLSSEEETQNLDSSVVSLVKFVMEQLSLVQISKNGRRYSANLLTTAFLWQLTSTSLYKKLKNLFLLPSISRLRQLSSGMTVEGGVLDMDYLKLRTADLNEQERIVALIIDEVYTAQRIEYSNGSFIGLTEDGAQAKTVLGFMVQSLMGKYKDVVCLVPVNKLDTSLLKTYFDRVMLALNKLFLVVAVCTDNHVCNR